MLSTAQTGNQSAQDVPAMHVLVVDDEPGFCQWLGSSLQRAGYVVSTAGDGSAALALFQQMGIDLVLLDLQLPEMDGYAVCAALRRDSAVPIVILSASSRAEDVLHSFQAGADEYIAKPFQLREVEGRLQKVLQRSHAKRQSLQEADAPLAFDLQVRKRNGSTDEGFIVAAVPPPPFIPVP
jgi:DNA-binding response OmpR family regulator